MASAAGAPLYAASASTIGSCLLGGAGSRSSYARFGHSGRRRLLGKLACRPYIAGQRGALFRNNDQATRATFERTYPLTRLKPFFQDGFPILRMSSVLQCVRMPSVSILDLFGRRSKPGAPQSGSLGNQPRREAEWPVMFASGDKRPI